jgi:cytochrome c oxidase subunit II
MNYLLFTIIVSVTQAIGVAQAIPPANLLSVAQAIPPANLLSVAQAIPPARLLRLAQAIPPASAPRVIEISAKRFQFTPNQITLKRGEPVTLRVTAEDRDHGFLQEDLGIDLDLEPGKVSEVTITPQTAGKFVAICDDFCGSGHGNMKMTIEVD